MTETEAQAIYCLLGAIDLEDGRPDISGVIDFILDIYRKPTPTRQELQHAAELCLQQNWLQILSEEDCEAELLRWEKEPHQNYSECPRRAGCADFTSAGWKAYVRLAKRLGKSSPQEDCRKSGQYLWRTPGCVSLIYMSRQLLLDDLAEVLSGKNSLVSDGFLTQHTITNTVGPYPIGSWWVKRRYLAPYGYRVDISFTPAGPYSEYGLRRGPE